MSILLNQKPQTEQPWIMKLVTLEVTYLLEVIHEITAYDQMKYITYS
jgi:hypothetical protein